MPFQKGQSGNPDGRPPKSRALTDLLEKAGSRTIELSDGKRISGKQFLARMLWELVTTGKATFPDGTKLVVDPADWLAMVKFIYTHIDGPPKGEMDITSGGEPLQFIEKVIHDDVSPSP